MLRENKTTEFKREYVDDIKHTAIAFANCDGGTIYIGMNDDGTVCGVQNADDTILRVTNAIRDAVRPDLTMFLDCRCEVMEGKDVICVYVQRGTARPYYLHSKGIRPEGVFVRQGASTVPASEAAILEMVSSIINPAGAVRSGEFSRTNEYIFFVMLGSASPADMEKENQNEEEDVHWNTLRRTDLSSVRLTRPRQFYPIYVDNVTRHIRCVGSPLNSTESRYNVPVIEGCTAVFPVRPDGTEMNWGITGEELMQRAKKGYVKVGRYSPNEYQQYSISYLKAGPISDIESGKAIIIGYDNVGAVICRYKENKGLRPTTQWNIKLHDAYRQGTNIISKIIGKGKFTFPKSLYAVKDCIRLFVVNNPNALIVDFFAGSGTTLHAVNLLNAEDGGHRRCIMVTNNEVSEAERKDFESRGIKPGDPEWESRGIARYVTWPRTVCSIEGHDVNGSPLKGNYITAGEQEMPMADGFKANAVFFKLGFLDKTRVSLGMQVKELLSILWMKAGAVGKCPVIDAGVPDMLILPENNMAILNNEDCFGEFAEKLTQHTEIEVVYLVTDYESSFAAMTQALEGRKTCQLYRDYLDNFRINAGRNGR